MYDIIGTIAVLDEKVAHPRDVALKLLRQKNIQSVYRRHAGHKGKYRVQKVTFIAGKRDPLTVYREHGLRMIVDVARVYFSPRLGTERMRIAKLVHAGERVIVLFGGVAPFALVIAKYSRAKRVTSVEWNPHAHALAEQNCILNKLAISTIKEDVRNVRGKYDRVIMVHPAHAVKYMRVAKRLCKKKGNVHVYAFARADTITSVGRNLAELLGGKLVHAQKTSQVAPGTFRMCYDLAKHA